MALTESKLGERGVFLLLINELGDSGDISLEAGPQE